jgi:hypothetical protein
MRYVEWAVKTDGRVTSGDLGRETAFRIARNIRLAGMRGNGERVRKVEVVSREVTLSDWDVHEIPAACPECQGEGFHMHGCWEGVITS